MMWPRISKSGASAARPGRRRHCGLPHPAYAKGFIRSYAAYVGLAAEEVATALVALNSDAEAAPPQSVYEPERLLAPSRNLRPFLALAAAWCCWLVWAGWPGGRERWIL